MVVRGIKEPAPHGAGFSYVNPYVKCCVISGSGAVILHVISVKKVVTKNLETRMNKRKTSSHKGCRFSLILVGVGGLEPPKKTANPA